MPKSSNSKRHRILGMAAALAVAVVVILVIAIVVVIVRRPADVTPGAQVPVTTTPPLTRPGQKPRPAFQSADCPDVQALIILAPGSRPARTTPLIRQSFRAHCC